VDFVDDHRLDGLEAVVGVRRQEQEQRFRRRDQDVGRRALEPGAFARRGIAGPHHDCRRMKRDGLCHGDVRNTGQRRAQVALDVDRQRLEGRYIENSAPIGCFGRRIEHQPVQRPQKRRQRLAASRRREDQGRFPARNRRPATLLRRSRLGEDRVEPCADRGLELFHISI